jgi:hypothetical protein
LVKGLQVQHPPQEELVKAVRVVLVAQILGERMVPAAAVQRELHVLGTLALAAQSA